MSYWWEDKQRARNKKKNQKKNFMASFINIYMPEWVNVYAEW